MAELALFLAAFSAATLLPFSSEAAFIVAISNDMPLLNAMVFASSGNILAIIFNYYLGYFLYEKTNLNYAAIFKFVVHSSPSKIISGSYVKEKTNGFVSSMLCRAHIPSTIEWAISS